MATTQPSTSVPTVKVTKPEDNNNSILDEPLCKYAVGRRLCVWVCLMGKGGAFLAQHMGEIIATRAGFWACQLIQPPVDSSSSHSHCLDRPVGIDVLRCHTIQL